MGYQEFGIDKLNAHLSLLSVAELKELVKDAENALATKLKNVAEIKRKRFWDSIETAALKAGLKREEIDALR